MQPVEKNTRISNPIGSSICASLEVNHFEKMHECEVIKQHGRNPRRVANSDCNLKANLRAATVKFDHLIPEYQKKIDKNNPRRHIEDHIKYYRNMSDCFYRLVKYLEHHNHVNPTIRSPDKGIYTLPKGICEKAATDFLNIAKDLENFDKTTSRSNEEIFQKLKNSRESFLNIKKTISPYREYLFSSKL